MPAPAAAALHTRLCQVKLVAFDVDGVLTDGGLYYTERGEEMKRFNVKDGQGLRSLMAHGIEVALISANESPATRQRAQQLGISHVYVGVADKLTTLQALCQRLDISLAQAAYIGDDINDVPVMQAVGCPMTVADAMPANLACALYVAQRGGGQGAVREICDYLLTIRQRSLSGGHG
jgi:3-deoxy-D-manno-octulosonate 8-phosphate phosphatase (KDO 8-P phosphatase)